MNEGNFKHSQFLSYYSLTIFMHSAECKELQRSTRGENQACNSCCQCSEVPKLLAAKKVWQLLINNLVNITSVP